MWQRLRLVVPGLLLLVTLVVRVADPGPIAQLRAQIFDEYQRLVPRAYEPAPVRIIDLDDETLRRYGQWPWPRPLVARLVDRLNGMGTAAIAFDIVFAEPDRTSPTQMLPLWAAATGLEALRTELEALPDHDQVLADSLAKARVVTGFALTAQAGGGKPRSRAGFATAGDDPRPFVPAYRGAVTNLAVIEAAALGNGSFNVTPERDGMIRRLPLVVRLNDMLYPSLAAEALRVAQGASTYLVRSAGAHGVESFGEHTGISSIKIGAVEAQTDPSGRVWLYDSGPVAGRIIPAWRILDGQVQPQALRGMIVLVGSSATGVQDIRVTPLQPVVAGVQLHAQLIEQVLHGDYLRRPDLADGVELLFLVGLSLLMLMLVRRLGAIRCAVLGGAVVWAAVGLSWYGFVRLKLMFDPTYPAAAALLVYLSASFVGYMSTEIERRRIRNAFGQYMSQAMVERLAADPRQLRLGGEIRETTVLFCDIRNFTGISEHLDAQNLTRLVNRFLTPMTDAVMAHQGTVDKYIGDCLMAFWNAPVDDPRHAANACDAALAMRQKLIALNNELAAEAGAVTQLLPIRMGIGLNSGHCCVGNLGSLQRFDYSALGDAVNVASRLEGLTKVFGTDIVIGERTRELAPRFAALELDVVRVRGKAGAARIYALLGDQAMAQSPDFQRLAAAHQRMLSAYRSRNWEEARRELAACREHDREGRLTTLYLVYNQRLAQLGAVPPPEDWDGVFAADGSPSPAAVNPA